MRKKESLSFDWVRDPMTPLPQVTQETYEERQYIEDPQLILDAWFAVVGAKTARNARPLHFEDGTLVVRVRNPIWLQELTMHRGRLVQDLNGELGGQFIIDLRLEQGILPPAPLTEDEKRPDWHERELPPHLQAEIEQKLSHLPENELKSSARRIMINHYKLTRMQFEMT